MQILFYGSFGILLQGWAFRNSACVPNIRVRTSFQIISCPTVICRSFWVDKIVAPTELHCVVSSISPHIWDQLSGRSAKNVAGRSSLSPQTQTLLQKRLQTSLYFRSIFATSWLSLVPSLTSVPRALSALQNTNRCY